MKLSLKLCFCGSHYAQFKVMCKDNYFESLLQDSQPPQPVPTPTPTPAPAPAPTRQVGNTAFIVSLTTTFTLLLLLLSYYQMY